MSAVPAADQAAAGPRLLSPFELRGVRLRNRIVISPMCQYSAVDGIANDWHLVHLGRFATGGAGLVFSEGTAVTATGRITHGDLGIWSDDHVPPLARVTAFIKAQGAVPGIQIAHAGRKASSQRPWHGNGPLDHTDEARGERPWRIVAPSPEPLAAGWLLPVELSAGEIADIVAAFAAAARRAHAAGFEVLEVHGAHGYLLHSFLSPLANRRQDAYGGSLAGRLRFAFELAEAVRAVWPASLPLFWRISSVDWEKDGWTLDDSLALARGLAERGIDLVDCSSGGIAGPATAAGVPVAPGYQVPFAERIRRETGLATQAVGLILTATQAEAVLAAGQADLVAIAREALFDPNWPLHAALELEGGGAWSRWPPQYGWWLERRAKLLGRPGGG